MPSGRGSVRDMLLFCVRRSMSAQPSRVGLPPHSNRLGCLVTIGDLESALQASAGLLGSELGGFPLSADYRDARVDRAPFLGRGRPPRGDSPRHGRRTSSGTVPRKTVKVTYENDLSLGEGRRGRSLEASALWVGHRVHVSWLSRINAYELR